MTRTQRSQATDLLDLALKDARDGFERLYFEEQLRRAGGNVSEVARHARVGRAAVHARLKKLGIDPDEFRDGARERR